MPAVNRLLNKYYFEVIIFICLLSSIDIIGFKHSQSLIANSAIPQKNARWGQFALLPPELITINFCAYIHHI
ncbi:unnamed protein product [Onchocerca flexuosa]|uniref:Uncharacterized protein n=1 Tax=Onchocerca flexuosa TaxID=387005 RepID=A0A183HN70_9BILA|nr:unnamed protein product [Onchocerca flexuosa]